ncbi:Zinc-iron permease, partial [Globisporangium splendens]
MVFFLDVNDKKKSQKILDWMLGFAGGVMIAASYWSLLAPAIEIAEESGVYGRWAFIPAAVGFGLGAAALFATESVLPMLENMFGRPQDLSKKDDDLHNSKVQYGEHRTGPDPMASYGVHAGAGGKHNSFRRVLLLVIAITLHNLPEGMAVGVGFGSIGHSPSATFSNAVSLAIGIGLQNFPEGLAVSMPLRREGMSAWKAFMWGQLSGLVEPFGGIIGAGAVLYVQPILPYALAFAAGAMIFVVVDDLIPEANQSGNQKLATSGVIVGFIVMMAMDVALG